MKDWFEILRNTGLIPVVTLNDAEKAPALASALVRGGLSAAEITFRTDAARDVIRRMRASEPDLFVGAGTVLTEAQLQDALAAGAEFIVAPGFNPKIADAALEAGVPYMPGVMTPTEIEAACALGLTALKYFPAEASGGVKMLKALSAPYRNVRFMPTGGISEDNLASYLSLPSVFCCGGSFVADAKLLEAGNFAGIEARARKTAELVSQIRGGGVHV